MWSAENGWQVIGVIEPPDMANVPTPSRGAGAGQSRGQPPRPQTQATQRPAPTPQQAPRRGATPAAKKPWPKRSR